MKTFINVLRFDHPRPKKARLSLIVTVDPHTYDLLINKYPEYVRGFDFEVKHYLDYVDPEDLVKGDRRITLHEPCHFVRHTEYERPRRLLEERYRLVLPAHSGRNTYCCGGPIEFLYPGSSEKIARRRLKELRDTGAELAVTACPICYSNLFAEGYVADIPELLSV
ncbi:MAG: heterodisulfide reductase-related iron-sulfur binding cluster [Nitrososphaeria archaeon]